MADPVERKKAQIELELAAEDRWLADKAKGGKAFTSMACYHDHKGVIYNYDGKPIPAPKDLDAKWLTDELLPLRCPHPPTAAKMATLIRLVKSESDSIGGSVACVCRRVPPALGDPVFDR